MNRIKNFLLFAALILVLFLSSLKLEGFFSGQSAREGNVESDILYRIFGQLRYDLAAMLYLEADEYFHGGDKPPAGHEHTIADELPMLPGHKSAKQDSAEKNVVPHQEPKDIISRLNARIHTRPVRHLPPAKQAEVLPWFYLATLMDPHYVNAYVIGGYWLSDHVNRPDQALKFMTKGIRYNPDAWQIYQQMGYVYFEIKKDYRKTESYLNRAYELMIKQNAGILAQRQVLVFLSAAAERSNDLPRALVYYRRLEKIWPNDKELQEKIKGIRIRIDKNPQS